jgi:radical SAM superfamily enzyme YgiQ (UPF0313 family)
LRVLFVHSEEDAYSPAKPLQIQERIQFGISYISSLLRREGHETRLVVLTRETPRLLEEEVRRYDPGMVCFTAVYSEYLFLSRAAASLKKRYPDLFLLLGGPHASLNPEACLRESPFHAVCVGEGEYPTLEAAALLEEGKRPTRIPNLYIRLPGGGVEVNPPRPFIEDLDTLPFPDRAMWIPWVADPLSRPSVLVGRGCPFRCTYCCNHALRKVAVGPYVRLRDPARVVDELEGLKRTHPALGEVYLEVETLGVDTDWALELCTRLRELNRRLEAPLAFGSNLRITPGRDYRRLFAALAEGGFKFVNIGLESGSERVRREVLKRHYSNEDVIRAVRAAREHGLKVGMYNLIGLPGESRKEFMETVRVNRLCQPDWFLLSVFFPYPGTELYRVCSEIGLLDRPPRPELERRKPVLDLPGFPKWEVGLLRALFPLLVYGGRKPTRDVLKLALLAEVYSHRSLIRWYRRVNGDGRPGGWPRGRGSSGFSLRRRVEV